MAVADFGTPTRPARCHDAHRLIKGWSSHELFLNKAPDVPTLAVPELWRCPPCHRKDATPWLVTAGTQHAVVYAGCDTAARAAMVVAFFRCLRDRPEELVRACALTPYARTEYQRADLDSPDRPTDELELARCWWVRVRQGMGKTGGRRTGWSISTVRNVSQARCTQRALNRMLEVAERLAQAQIECKPAVDVITERASPESVVYVDPPYPVSTRVVRGGGDYRHEMTDDDHRELAAVLRITPAAVLLSSYPSDLYDELYDGWDRIEVATTTSASNINHDGRARAPRTEVIWSNRPINDGRLFGDLA